MDIPTIKQIQLDAWKQGMNDAAAKALEYETADHNVSHGLHNELLKEATYRKEI